MNPASPYDTYLSLSLFQVLDRALAGVRAQHQGQVVAEGGEVIGAASPGYSSLLQRVPVKVFRLNTRRKTK